jgi:DNA repair exonuclease SbcCD ATPase subunit
MISGMGVRPNSVLAKKPGIVTGKNIAIPVNKRMETSAPHNRFAGHVKPPCGNRNIKAEGNTMDRKELIDNLAAQLEQLDKKIDELETKAEKSKTGARLEYDSQINDLKHKMAEAQEKLKELKTSGDEAWKELREGVEKAMDEVDGAVKRAISEF